MSGVFPLVVGITGHRDPADPMALSGALETRFAEIEEIWPGLRKVLLSAMAVGTDRLAADLAAARGWEVIVVLPMPEEAYLCDFDLAEQADFRRAIAGRSRIHAWDLDGLAQDAPRVDLYRAAGLYIAEHAHLMLSAWNGRPADEDSQAGTGDITRARLVETPQRPPTETEKSNDAELRLTCVIPTPRRSDEGWLPEGWTGGWCCSWKTAVEGRGEAQLSKLSCQGLTGVARVNAAFGGKEIEASDDRLRAAFDIIDRATTARIARTRQIWGAIFALACGALAASTVYGDLSDLLAHPQFALVTYLLLLWLLVMLVGYEDHRQREFRNSDMRLLTEALRILMAWRVVGAAALRPTLHAMLLQIDRVSPWVPAALRGLSVLPHREITPMAEFDRLRMQWIEGQIDYLSRKMARRAARHEAERDYVFAGFMVGIMAALAALLLDILGWRGQLWWTLAWTLAGLLPTLAALMLTWTTLRASTVASRRADQLHRRFTDVLEFGQEPFPGPCPDELRRQVLEIGQEALLETLSWYDSHARAEGAARDLSRGP